MAQENNFWERMEDGWKEWYRQEDNTLRNVYKGSVVEGIVESQSFIDAATAFGTSLMGSSTGTSTNPNAPSMPGAGKGRRTTTGKSASPGTFRAGKTDLGYTARVDSAVSKMTQSRSPSIQATYQRLQGQRARGPLIGLEAPEIRVRRG